MESFWVIDCLSELFVPTDKNYSLFYKAAIALVDLNSQKY